jgi:DNA-binding response OmpR family regulator
MIVNRGQEARERTGAQRPAYQPIVASGLTGTKVLCVAEDLDFARDGLVPCLEQAGSSVDLRTMGGPLPISASLSRFQAIVFAIASDDTSNWARCAAARSACTLPIMLVLHGAARACILRALESGADSYVLAPFDPREFLARLAALKRRLPRAAQD